MNVFGPGISQRMVLYPSNVIAAVVDDVGVDALVVDAVVVGVDAVVDAVVVGVDAVVDDVVVGVDAVVDAVVDVSILSILSLK